MKMDDTLEAARRLMVITREELAASLVDTRRITVLEEEVRAVAAALVGLVDDTDGE